MAGRARVEPSLSRFAFPEWSCAPGELDRRGPSAGLILELLVEVR